MNRVGPIRIGVLGCGFWSKYQIAAWRELESVQIVALYNRTRSKAEAVGKQFGIDAIYDDAEELIRQQRPDALDIITSVETHADFARLAAKHGIPVICQKPMAPTLAAAQEMVRMCGNAGVPLFIHENWRWQTPIRQLKQVLMGGEIGQVFRARIDFINGFPVFANQPFLRELEQFILTDIGSHILDTARFLFGEMTSLCCQTRRIHGDIKGEDVATVMMRNQAGAAITCNMAYAENHLEHDRFPETFIFVEGTKGSIELGPDYWIRVTTSAGTHARRFPPPRYPWADPAYDLVQSSIVPCNKNLLDGLRGTGTAETTGEDNLKTVKLVFASYESARRNQVVEPDHFA